MEFSIFPYDAPVFLFAIALKIRYNDSKTFLIKAGGFMYNPQLETFLRVADAGSFNKAAEQSYITPTAVSKQSLVCSFLSVLTGACG